MPGGSVITQCTMGTTDLTEELTVVFHEPLRSLGKSSTTHRMRKGDRTHHNNTPQYRNQWEPEAGAQPFKEYVTWDLSEHVQNVMNSHGNGDVLRRTRKKRKGPLGTTDILYQ